MELFLPGQHWQISPLSPHHWKQKIAAHSVNKKQGIWTAIVWDRFLLVREEEYILEISKWKLEIG
jgi:hypothetical protein